MEPKTASSSALRCDNDILAGLSEAVELICIVLVLPANALRVCHFDTDVDVACWLSSEVRFFLASIYLPLLVCWLF